MELWVRSQDKTKLVKVNQLEYDYTKIKEEERHKIITVLNNDCFVLGIYKTKERAFEVLDEIQEFLTFDEDHYEGLNKVSYQQCNMYKSNVLMSYEMPKE